MKTKLANLALACGLPALLGSKSPGAAKKSTRYNSLVKGADENLQSTARFNPS